MNALIFDLETLAMPDAEAYLEPVAAPANYKDAEKIKAYQLEKRAELLGRCALDPDLCTIVAFGCMRDISDVPTCYFDVNEVDLIRLAWTHLESASTLIGYNILSFDLPVLIRRSQYLGVPVPAINLDRYRTPHIDLMERLSFNGKLKYRGLDFYCKRFGIAFEDPYSGKDIAQLVADGQWDAVAAHCLADVRKTHALAQRLGYVQAPAPVGAF